MIRASDAELRVMPDKIEFRLNVDTLPRESGS